MRTSKAHTVRAGYDRDYWAWLQEQSRALRARRLEQIDADNVAEELEDLGKAVVRELESRLEVLTAHLLKWAYQPERRGPGWENTIDEQRARVLYLLRKNPSLRSQLEQILADAYPYARRSAGSDMDLTPKQWKTRFPSACPWSAERVLDTSFLPDAQSS